MAFFNKKSSKSKKKSKSKEPKDYTLLNKVMGSLFFAFAMFLTLASISYLAINAVSNFIHTLV